MSRLSTALTRRRRATRSSGGSSNSGASVIAALASNAIDIGYAGSSPLAAGVTRGAPIEAFLVAGLIGKAEGLVVRNGSGVNDIKDLVGKKVATPFVSTAHYSLLFALKQAGVDATKVNVLNLQPPEIAAAFARGDIDGAYVWDPVLTKAKENGKVLIDSAGVAKLGGPTFVAWITRKGLRRSPSRRPQGLHSGHARHLCAFPQGPGRLQGRDGERQEDRGLQRRQG